MVFQERLADQRRVGHVAPHDGTHVRSLGIFRRLWLSLRKRGAIEVEKERLVVWRHETLSEKHHGIAARYRRQESGRRQGETRPASSDNFHLLQRTLRSTEPPIQQDSEQE